MKLFRHGTFALVTTAMAILSPAVSANTWAEQAVNQFRSDAGLAPLKYSRTLERVARKHAEDMARQGAMTHYSRDGSGPAQRAVRAGYYLCRVSENIAWGQKDLPQVINEWYVSPGHRKNMLNRNLREFGVARAEGNYWVMVIADPGCEKAAGKILRGKAGKSSRTARLQNSDR